MEGNSKFTKFHEQFEKLNFGTVVSTTDFQVITVKINPDFMIRDYAGAIANDLQRRNPLRFDAIEKQLPDLMLRADESGDFGEIKNKEVISFVDELTYYVTGLAKIRIQAVFDRCKVWRLAKRLAIPPYVQFVISMIGKVNDVEHGRQFVPEIDGEQEVDMSRMLRISQILASFEDDGVVLLYDAFPRSKFGDKETMSYAIIDSYVKGIDRAEVAKSYITAFLGMKLKKEREFKAIYSVRYDNVDFIKDCLIDELVRL